MGDPLPDREAQAAEVLDRLEAEYPDATVGLEFSTRFQLLVATVLSAQCTDERVNSVTPELFEKYPDPEAFAALTPEELAGEIDSITFYNNKAGYIVDSARRIVEEHGGEVPDEMAALTDLSGVGRKTANVVLQHGHDRIEGVVVDTHVQRLSRRLGLTEEERPERIEEDLMGVLDRDDWRRYTDLLIAHGRARCSARNPDCADCELEDLCPSSKLDSPVDLADGEEW